MTKGMVKKPHCQTHRITFPNMVSAMLHKRRNQGCVIITVYRRER